MATDYTREIVRSIDKLTGAVGTVNKLLLRIADNLAVRTFDQMPAPKDDKILTNMNGATLMKTETFNQLWEIAQRFEAITASKGEEQTDAGAGI